jgi:hypothetical protein
MKTPFKTGAFALALAVAVGGAGGVIAAVVARHSAGERRTAAVVGGVLIAWAVVSLVGVSVSVQRKAQREAQSTLTSSDWRVINAEMVADAERAASKAWLFGLVAGLGIPGLYVALSGSLWWLSVAPLFFLGAWFQVRRGVKDAKKLVEPMDPETRRYWNRTRSP